MVQERSKDQLFEDGESSHGHLSRDESWRPSGFCTRTLLGIRRTDSGTVGVMYGVVSKRRSDVGYMKRGCLVEVRRNTENVP